MPPDAKAKGHARRHEASAAAVLASADRRMHPQRRCSGSGAWRWRAHCSRRRWSCSAPGCASPMPAWDARTGRAATDTFIRMPALPTPLRFHFAKALHEMIHRYFAATLGASSLPACSSGRCASAGDRGQPLFPAASAVRRRVFAGALGALTVTLLLKPLIVTAHLLGGLTTLGLLWWLSLTPAARQLTRARSVRLRNFALARPCRADRCRLRSAAGPAPTMRRWPARICPPASTPGGRPWTFAMPSCCGAGSASTTRAACSRIPHASPFTSRIGSGAVVGGFDLDQLGRPRPWRAQEPAAAAWRDLLLVAACCCRSRIGVAMVHWGMPLPLATLHNAGAAFLVVSMVTAAAGASGRRHRSAWYPCTVSTLPDSPALPSPAPAAGGIFSSSPSPR